MARDAARPRTSKASLSLARIRGRRRRRAPCFLNVCFTFALLSAHPAPTQDHGSPFEPTRHGPEPAPLPARGTAAQRNAAQGPVSSGR